MVRSGFCLRQMSCDNDNALSIFAPVSTIASHIFRNIPCITFFRFFYGFGSVFDQRSEPLLVLFVVLSPQGLFFLFSSLVRCFFLLLRLFFFPCFEFRVVWGSASFVVLFVLSFHRVIMRYSSGSSRFVGLSIEGRPAEESELG